MTAGLVLAAGAARRFGGAKQVAQLDGHPLIHYPLHALHAAGIDRIAVVVGAHQDVVTGVLPDDVDVVVCLGWEEGLAASVRAGVAALSDADRVVVCLADQPGITADAVRKVLEADGEDVEAVRALYDGVPGHPVLLGPVLLERAGELTGDAGFRELLAGAHVRAVEVGHLGSAADVDTVDDLEALAP